MNKADILIVGGGIMGCTLAWKLAESGLRPVVLERSVPGAEASTAAAGILGPAVEAHDAGIALRLGLESRELHAAQAERLREEHGLDIGFRRCGALMTSFSAEQTAHLKERAAFLEHADVPHELLSSDAARELEPSLHPDVQGALSLPTEAQLDPRALLRALAIAAERSGATFQTGAMVRRIRKEGARVVGVELDDGFFAAPQIILAAGSWTTQLAGCGLTKEAVRPIRGQILQSETRPPIFNRLVFGRGGYVVPRVDGTVLAGSTAEDVGFDRSVTLGGMSCIIETARGLAPALSNAPLKAHWSSFRPATPDGLPLIGAMPTEGLYIASGHFRNGILMGPVTGEIIRDLLLGRGREGLESLSPTRFIESASA